MEYEQQDVEDFIGTFLKSIKKSIGKGYYICDAIEFELAVVKTKKMGGGFKIFVADAKGEYSKEKLSTVKFKVKPRSTGKGFRIG